MKLNSHITPILLLLNSVLLSCNNTPQPVEISNAELLAQSKSLAKEYSTSLKKKVKSKILTDGIEAAVEFCSLNAIPLTDSISKAKNVVFKRVSHKNRNTDNSAGDFELELIEAFQQTSSKSPKLFKAGSSELFYAPIYIDTPLCLNCHGDPKRQMSPALVQKIDSIYPKDRAKGFTEGELRGLLKIVYTSN